VQLPFHLDPLDPILIGGTAVLVAHAVRRGFVPYLTELVAFALALAVALPLAWPAGQLIHRHLGIPQNLAGFGAFLIMLAIVHALVQTPMGKLCSRLAAAADGLPPAPRAVTNAVPALGVAALISALGLSSLLVLPFSGAQRLVQGSLLAPQVTALAAPLQGPLQRLLVPGAPSPDQILVSAPPVNPGQDAFYRLKFPRDLQVQPAPADEEAMLQQINQARAQAGLAPLVMNPVLREAARQHSLDMYRRHYFSHRTPSGQTPYQRLQALHFRYVTAGENIAFAENLEQAWSLLMASPDHRANILNPDFRCVGIGAYRGLGGYEEMFTQDFADCT
jgi:uncharacterized protein YkwD